jgi:hypothetical protein
MQAVSGVSSQTKDLANSFIVSSIKDTRNIKNETNLPIGDTSS